jgi:hypothetical protein
MSGSHRPAAVDRYPAADGCIEAGGVGRQAVIARVEQASRQVSRDALPAPTVVADTKIVEARALQTRSDRFGETDVKRRGSLISASEQSVA